MNQLIEAHCKGSFRSYKTFRSSGQVVLHTIQNFQEWDFNDNHILTITAYVHPRKKIICQTDKWRFTFQNKRHYITIDEPPMEHEILTVNHTGLVLANAAAGEKIFFARLTSWEGLIRKGLPVF